MALRWNSFFPILLAVTSLSSAAKERISILDFGVSATAKKAVNQDASQDLTQQVRDAATNMIDPAKFEVMTRENILVMLPPGKKDLSECEGQCEVETARNLGSRWHVVGDVKKVGTRLVLSVRLYDVAGGTQLGGIRVTGADLDTLASNVEPKAKELFSKIPGLGTIPSTAAAGGGKVPEPATPPPPVIVVKRVANFTSFPLGATVVVDGTPVGSTPCSKELVEGDHEVAMSLQGYHSERRQVKLANDDQEIEFQLEVGKARLSLKTVDDRTGAAVPATVYVNDAKVGQTPFDGFVSVDASKIVVYPAAFEPQGVNVVLEDGKTADTTLHFRSEEPPKPGEGMVAIPAGCFVMGGGSADESPRHRVCLKGFTLDKTDVTNAAYQGSGRGLHYQDGSCYRFSGTSLVKGDISGPFQEGDHPVVCVDWNEAKRYCESQGKRLPTEAEWEYAARAGATTLFYWGDEWGREADHAWFSENSGGATHPVAQKPSNDWGLHDMAGNVWKWVSDWYGKDYYSLRVSPNPTGPAEGSNRVVRGGSWDSRPGDLRSSFRNVNDPGSRQNFLGFRCAAP